jgi:hypothetical protein
MNRKRPHMWIGIALLALAALLLPAGAALANGLGYTLDWWTVDGGGGTWSDTGGRYELNGTVGQPDVGVWGDGEYTLTGGFWGGGKVQYNTYLPLALKE